MSNISTSPCRAFIHLARIRRNFNRLGDPQRLIPVIKSDAYGHGLIPIGAALAEAGARSFAVGTVEEALALREAGLGSDMLLVLLGAADGRETARAHDAELTLLVHNRHSLELAAAQGTPEHPLRIAVKWNTGMARLGFSPTEAGEVIERLRALPNLRPTLCMSHIAAADVPGEAAFTAGQTAVFSKIAANMKNVFPSLRASLANSAGILGHPEASFDVSRPGIALYGGNPFYGTNRENLGKELECAMEIGAPILNIRELKIGESVSYGRTFTAPRTMRAGIAAIGYADGYARAFSGRGRLMLRGRRIAVLGRVCMGMILLDLSETPEAQCGDTAWALGGEGDAAIGVHELADAWNSVSYEIFCLLGRNTKKYV